jgi:hypothetical protein
MYQIHRKTQNTPTHQKTSSKSDFLHPIRLQWKEAHAAKTPKQLQIYKSIKRKKEIPENIEK